MLFSNIAGVFDSEGFTFCLSQRATILCARSDHFPIVMDADEERADDGRLMGIVIGCYLVCMGCCSMCCIAMIVLLLLYGSLCLLNEDGTDCGSSGYPSGGYSMLLFGSIPPCSALLLLLYLQGDKRGWWRPDYVAPGTSIICSFP